MEDKNRKRAIRRAHYQRLKKKVEWYYGGQYVDAQSHYDPNDSEKCGVLANTQKLYQTKAGGYKRKEYS